ncbi:hypothetical protein [Pedobacter aquatilis]|uniref:hypothetical protein n=1 Tax=Pedobacter aquatilis TaxID=351343 RepID=UPI00292CC4F8|nr:hypothetical protein [Pedobacter aquatilis]
MNNTNKIKSILALIAIMFFSVSAKIETKTAKQDEICERVIKYYVKSGKEGDKEFKLNAVITVNPINLINVDMEIPNQPKTNFDIIIESADCDLNTELTKGTALYKGYVKHENGDATNSVIKISRDDKGKLTISNADPELPKGLTLYVDKWEVFNN